VLRYHDRCGFVNYIEAQPLLHDAARPDKDFIAWYEPTIGSFGAEPDFILYGSSLELLVVEIKDWDIDQIGEVSPHTVKFWTGDKEETRTSPDRQAKGYLNELMDLLQGHQEFHQGSGKTRVLIHRNCLNSLIRSGAQAFYF
jgi:hypothetical protein